MQLMNVLFAVETALRTLFQPDKINLASLGNLTPHVHWHLIPRWRDDRQFPLPVWAMPQRPPPARRREVMARNWVIRSSPPCDPDSSRHWPREESKERSS
jgi:diadenosine tetraphosphate (Ap4A) HIT family hydrolase